MERWLQSQGAAEGRVVPLRTVWELSKAWYPDPRRADWRPRTRDESQQVLASLGLTDEFWTLLAPRVVQ